MAQYSKLAQGQFTSSGTAQFIELPFMPNTVQVWNKTASTTHVDDKALNAISTQSDAPGTASATFWDADIPDAGGIGTQEITSGGITFVRADTFRFGPTVAITSVVQVDPAGVTTAAPHNLSTGDAVLIYATTGMHQIAGEIYTVTVATATTFSIDVDSSGFTSAATSGFMKKVLYPDLYIPHRASITRIALGPTTTITTSVNHAFVVGQEVLIQIPTVSPTAWGTFQLDTETFNQQNVIPQQAYVLSVPTSNSIEVNVNSSGFGAFEYPTPAEANLGMTFPAVYAIGSQNFGLSGPGPFSPPITIPGAFAANTFQGIVVGTGDAITLHAVNDLVRWEAILPDLMM